MAITCFSAGLLTAQDVSGSLRGTVLDASGGLSPAQTSPPPIRNRFRPHYAERCQGDYLLVALPVGHYRLDVEAKEFRTYSRGNHMT